MGTLNAPSMKKQPTLKNMLGVVKNTLAETASAK